MTSEMIHYTVTIFSDMTLCGQPVYEVSRKDEVCTPILKLITCDKCILEIENILRKTKNGAT